MAKERDLHALTDAEFYEYTELPKLGEFSNHPDTSNHVRLFTLLPGRGSEPLRGTIEVVELSPGTEFEALSYVWGNPKPSQQILCNDKILCIAKNLDTALFYIRLPDCPRLLWIDAICINQNNSRERGHQVKAMGLVFSTASRVLVWLGEATGLAEQAMSMVQWLVKFAMGLTQPLSIRTWREALADALKNNAQPKTSWSALLSLFGKEWFRRIWTVQEVVKAKNAVVLFGTDTVSWEIIGIVLLLLGISSDILHRYDNALECHTRLPACGSTVVLSENVSHRTLLSALYFTAGKNFAEKRDRVYGILGLVNPILVARIDVNYEWATTTMMREITIEALKCECSLDILSPGPVGHLKYPPLFDKPSWVFDWIRFRPRAPPFPIGKETYFSACGDRCLEVRHGQDRSVLLLRGRLVDSIHLGMVNTTYNRQLHLVRSVMFAFGSHNSFASSVEQKHPRLRQYIQTIFGGATTWDVPSQCLIRGPPSTDWDGTLPGLEFLLAMLQEKWEELPVAVTQLLYHFYGRQFCKTRDGRLGLISEAARPGDVVAVLDGGRTPFVLRLHEDGYYSWLGEAYIDGLMHGEATSMVQFPIHDVLIR